MLELKIILARLKKPSVIISVTSQIMTMMILGGFDVDKNLILAIVATACSILVTLGILSNPDTRNKSYGEDLQVCSTCGKLRQHTELNGEMVCKICGVVDQTVDLVETLAEDYPKPQ